MTDTEINQSIAEACGPKLFVLHKPLHDPFGYYRENANGYTNDIEKAWRVTAEVAAKYINGREDQPDRVIAEPAPCPNYCGDLNAMHEAEKTIAPVRVPRYISEVWAAMCKGGNVPEMDIGTIHATARQRAEAFLRTVGKWVAQ